jgi:hypothetical protein
MAKSNYLTVADFNKALPKEVADLYKIVRLEKKTSLVIFFHKYGKVDFSKMNLIQAEKLVNQKAPFIEAKEAKKAEA